MNHKKELLRSLWVGYGLRLRALHKRKHGSRYHTDDAPLAHVRIKHFDVRRSSSLLI